MEGYRISKLPNLYWTSGFKDVLPEYTYIHFLAFSVAIDIMLSTEDERVKLSWYAKQLLEHFVNHSHIFFEAEFNVYNVQSLIRLYDDIVHFKCNLNEMSGFPFENHIR